MKPLIPKKLHFTYKSEDIPRAYQENLRRWQAFCPDWEVNYYSDQKVHRFFQSYFPEYAEDVKRVPVGAALADLFRYGVLFIHGGMYNDMDTIPLKPIPDEWLSYQGVIGYEYQPSGAQCAPVISFTKDSLCQWSLLSKPGNSLFKRVLDRSILALRKKNYTFKTIIDVLETTGPILFTETIEPYLDSPDLLVLHMEVFSPMYLLNIDLDRCVVFHQFHGRSGWKMELKCPHIKII